MFSVNDNFIRTLVFRLAFFALVPYVVLMTLLFVFARRGLLPCPQVMPICVVASMLLFFAVVIIMYRPIRKSNLKYENLIRAMRETMDNVAHDFRTPLARIRGACELAIARSDLPSGLTEMLADVIDDCDHAKVQLQNLMDTREMENGFVKINSVRFRLDELLRDLIDMYGSVADEKKIKLETVFPQDGVSFVGDRERLARAFANLIDNAVKYTPKRGTVTVGLKSRENGVEVSVRDTGMGIPEDEYQLIWQRLYRSTLARKFKKSGLGLGLNIVQVVISAHGGTVNISSKVGEGTEFVISLPEGKSEKKEE